MFSKSFKQNSILTPQSGVIDARQTTGGFVFPSGTTAQRPISPTIGSQRWNTTINSLEIYTSASNWQVIASTAYTLTYLVVAGGGGGGLCMGGGGGAGGLLYSTATVTPGTQYVAFVGSGGMGSGSRGWPGGSGASSSISNAPAAIVAVGGGGGSSWNQSGQTGDGATAGGSGGGGNNGGGGSGVVVIRYQQA